MINSNIFRYLLISFLFLYSAVISQESIPKIKKLTKKADLILTGKVAHKESAWNGDKTRIYTKTSIQVDEYLKGLANGNTVEVVIPGGEVGDIGELYTHMPAFEDDEEVLVFLKKDKKSKTYQVLNGQEGKIKIQKTGISKDKVAGSNSSISELKVQIKQFVNE